MPLGSSFEIQISQSPFQKHVSVVSVILPLDTKWIQTSLHTKFAHMHFCHLLWHLWCSGATGTFQWQKWKVWAKVKEKRPSVTQHVFYPPGSYNYLSFQILSTTYFLANAQFLFLWFVLTHRQLRNMLHLLQRGHQLRGKPRNWRHWQRHTLPNAPYLFPKQETAMYSFHLKHHSHISYQGLLDQAQG